jgi:hypothetical protein
MSAHDERREVEFELPPPPPAAQSEDAGFPLV